MGIITSSSLANFSAWTIMMNGNQLIWQLAWMINNYQTSKWCFTKCQTMFHHPSPLNCDKKPLTIRCETQGGTFYRRMQGSSTQFWSIHSDDCQTLLTMLTCLDIAAHRRMWSVTNYFLLNLAVADILMATFNCIFSFIYMRDRQTWQTCLILDIDNVAIHCIHWRFWFWGQAPQQCNVRYHMLASVCYPEEWWWWQGACSSSSRVQITGGGAA